MIWLKLGWRNLWRNKRRTIIEILSIGGSVFLCVIWNNLAVGSYNQMIDLGVRMGSGHIGIYHERYLEERKTEDVVNHADEIVTQIEELPGVSGVFPRLQVPALIRSARESRSTGLMGLDFVREIETNPILASKRLIEGSIPSPENGNTALIGYRLARELNLVVGNKFVIMAQDAEGEIASSLFRVAGIIRTNVRELDASVVVVDRKILADIIKRPDSAHEVAVLLENHQLIGKTKPHIDGIVRSYPPAVAYPWQEAMEDLAASIQIDHVGLEIMVIILYIIVGIGTINTILMSVMERAREFGVVRAIGVNKSGVRMMVFAEAFVLACVGIACGIFASFLVGLYTSTHGIDLTGMIEEQGVGGVMFDPIMYSTWDITGTAVMIIAMLLVALAASLYPAHYVLKIRPSEAMRKY